MVLESKTCDSGSPLDLLRPRNQNIVDDDNYDGTARESEGDKPLEVVTPQRNRLNQPPSSRGEGDTSTSPPDSYVHTGFTADDAGPQATHGSNVPTPSLTNSARAGPGSSSRHHLSKTYRKRKRYGRSSHSSVESPDSDIPNEPLAKKPRLERSNPKRKSSDAGDSSRSSKKAKPSSSPQNADDTDSDSDFFEVAGQPQSSGGDEDDAADNDIYSTLGDGENLSELSSAREEEIGPSGAEDGGAEANDVQREQGQMELDHEELDVHDSLSTGEDEGTVRSEHDHDGQEEGGAPDDHNEHRSEDGKENGDDDDGQEDSGNQGDKERDSKQAEQEVSEDDGAEEDEKEDEKQKKEAEKKSNENKDPARKMSRTRGWGYVKEPRATREDAFAKTIRDAELNATALPGRTTRSVTRARSLQPEQSAQTQPSGQPRALSREPGTKPPSKQSTRTKPTSSASQPTPTSAQILQTAPDGNSDVRNNPLPAIEDEQEDPEGSFEDALEAPDQRPHNSGVAPSLPPVTAPNNLNLANEATSTRNSTLNADRSADRAQAYTIFVCGDNRLGQLGLGDHIMEQKVPVINDCLTAYELKDFDCGASHCIALTSGGTVLTWGLGTEENYGLGTPWQPDAVRKLPSPVNLTRFREKCGNVIQVVATNDASFALFESGDVVGWGYFKSTETFEYRGPALVEVLRGIEKMAGGGQHILAISKDGVVWAMGNNEKGQLGFKGGSPGAGFAKAVRMKTHTAKKAAQIACGENTGFFIDKEGQLYSWGDNDKHQLGAGFNGRSQGEEQIDIPKHVQISADGRKRKVISVAGGADHSLACDEDGHLWLWGSCGDLAFVGSDENDSRTGQPPSRSLSDQVVNIPTKVPDCEDVESVAAGAKHSVYLDNEKRAYTWGSSNRYQTGQESNCDGSPRFTIDQPEEVQAGDIANYKVVRVAAGATSTIFACVKK